MKKKIFIVGASRGIGYDLAKFFISTGADLYLCARTQGLFDVKKKHNWGKSTVRFKKCDITKKKDRQKLCDNVLKYFKGRPDFIFHCAGGTLGVIFQKSNIDSIKDVFELNLFSQIDINQKILAGKKNRKIGIIHFSTILAFEAARVFANAMSRAALNSYIKNMGVQALSSNFRILGIALGSTVTSGNIWDERLLSQNEIQDDYVKKFLPIGRFLNSEDIIPFINYLVTTNSDCFNSTVISMDAGQSKYVRE